MLPKLLRKQAATQKSVFSSQFEAILDHDSSTKNLTSNEDVIGMQMEDNDVMEMQSKECEESDMVNPEYIYIYWTDERVSSQTYNQLNELCLSNDPWATRIILCHSQKDYASSDPLAILSLLRYVK